MSPSLTPRQPGTRWRIIIAKLNPDGTTIDDWVDFEGDAYVVAVANETATRITADLDFAGNPATCLRLLAHLTESIDQTSER